MRLTDLSLRKLPIPASGQKTYWEQGFGVRVSQGGTKSFVVMTGQQRKLHTIGKYPDISLKTARRRAQELKLDQTPSRALDSLSVARSAFLEDCQSRLRPATIEQYTYQLNRTDVERLSKLKRRDVDQGPHSIAAWKAFYNWCVREELVARNPFAFAVCKYNQRDRVLTDDEIKAIWHYDYPPYSDYLKVLILTGQRRGQLYYAELRDDTIYFPAEHMKSGVAHTIPLTETVQKLLPLPYFNGWSKAKARLDKTINIQPFTIHDLRRTFSTNCAALGIFQNVTEEILAHRSGQRSGVSAVYNRYSYLPEMREALTRYENHILSLVA